VILIPEIAYDLGKVCDVLVARQRAGKRFSIVCVSEGAKPEGGDVVVMRRVETSPDPIRLGGIANKLVADIEATAKIECRATILGHVQRGGSPTPGDRVLATQFGHSAMSLVVSGAVDQLVVLRDGRLDHIPIGSVAGKQRKVPPDDRLLLAARAVGTSFGD
jgi:6-phosphofructokinase 1